MMNKKKTPPGRLPSFRPVRDLTLRGMTALGGEPKLRRTYKPNLNVKRKKLKEELHVIKNTPCQDNDSERKHIRGRGVHKLIRASGGIFSEGSSIRERQNYGEPTDDERKIVSKHPTFPNLQHNFKINEVTRLQEQFENVLDIPIPKQDTYLNPIQLPFHSVKKANVKSKPEVPIVNHVDEDAIGVMRMEEDVVNVKIKQEKMEDQSLIEEEHDKKWKCEMEIDDHSGNNNERNVAEFFNHSKTRMFFVQLPDCLPGSKREVELDGVRPSTCKNSHTATTSKSHAGQPLSKKCSLNFVSEGCIGKIELMKSGKARFVLKNTMMHLAPSLQLGYREDLVSVDLDSSSHTGDMINLGKVDSRLMCSPHWESMIPSFPK